jgi:hypothetical protein
VTHLKVAEDLRGLPALVLRVRNGEGLFDGLGIFLQPHCRRAHLIAHAERQCIAHIGTQFLGRCLCARLHYLVTEIDSVPWAPQLVDIGAQPRDFSLEPEYPGYEIFVDLSPASSSVTMKGNHGALAAR